MRSPGQYFEAETGLHYNWHRYYDPSTGRYFTPDPIGLNGGMNLYAYANQNPVNFIDPYGLYSVIELQKGGVFHIRFKPESKTSGYYRALTNYTIVSIGSLWTVKDKMPPIPNEFLRKLYKYDSNERVYEIQGYYIREYEVNYDDCTGEETSRKFLRRKKGNETERVLLYETKTEKYIGEN